MVYVKCSGCASGFVELDKINRVWPHWLDPIDCKSLSSFVYQVTELLFKWLNRRSQCKSYNWEGFKELIKYFGIAKPHICHAL